MGRSSTLVSEESPTRRLRLVRLGVFAVVLVGLIAAAAALPILLLA